MALPPHPQGAHVGRCGPSTWSPSPSTGVLGDTRALVKKIGLEPSDQQDSDTKTLT